MSKSIFFTRYEELGEKPHDVKISPTIRVNTLKTDAKTVLLRLQTKGFKITKIPFLPDGYIVRDGNQSAGSTTEYLLGHYYTQEAASQIPALILDPKPGELILDMAAAPGGKTTQMAALMQNTGTLMALDRGQRLYSIKNNIERMGVKNTIVIKKDARFVMDFGRKFAKILLDAPCSGNFIGDDKWLKKRTLEDIQARATLQKELIKAAARALAPGGTLVYSTCSLEPEENEMVIDFILKKDGGLRCVPIDFPIGDKGLVKPFGETLSKDIANCKRIWPWKSQTEGFFVAKLVRA